METTLTASRLRTAGKLLVVFFAGWGVVGNQGTLNALAATYYPTALRSTGVGWCLGVGRVGAIVGPLVAGELIGRMWTVQQLFFAAASLSCIGGIAMMSLRFVMQPDGSRSPEKVLAR